MCTLQLYFPRLNAYRTKAWPVKILNIIGYYFLPLSVRQAVMNVSFIYTSAKVLVEARVEFFCVVKFIKFLFHINIERSFPLLFGKCS